MQQCGGGAVRGRGGGGLQHRVRDRGAGAVRHQHGDQVRDRVHGQVRAAVPNRHRAAGSADRKYLESVKNISNILKNISVLDGDGGAVRPGGGSLVPHGDGDGDGVRVLGGRQPAAVQHGVRGAVRHQAGAAVHHRQRAGVPGDNTAPPLSS